MTDADRLMPSLIACFLATRSAQERAKLRTEEIIFISQRREAVLKRTHRLFASAGERAIAGERGGDDGREGRRISSGECMKEHAITA